MRPVGYTCYSCNFRTDRTTCLKCEGLVVWEGGTARCTGCRERIVYTICRKCGSRFNI